MIYSPGTAPPPPAHLPSLSDVISYDPSSPLPSLQPRWHPLVSSRSKLVVPFHSLYSPWPVLHFFQIVIQILTLSSVPALLSERFLRVPLSSLSTSGWDLGTAKLILGPLTFYGKLGTQISDLAL